jgi:glyoxylate/hydroxypyruvate reductase A
LVENDLLEAIEAGILSGAMLDVFAKEPLPKTHPFWNHPKISMTPHVASLTNFDSAIDFIVENYNRMLSKQSLLHVVSPVKGY